MTEGGVCKRVTLEEVADIMEVSSVELELDLGHSFLYRVNHPSMGRIVLVNSSVGDSAVMPV